MQAYVLLILFLLTLISFIIIVFNFSKKSKSLKNINEFEKLIMKISSDFIKQKSSNIDETINDTLKLIGKYFDSDRSYIFLFSDYQKNMIQEEKDIVMNNTHEWCSKGISSQIENLQNLPPEIMPWWVNRIKNNVFIYIPNVSNMPEEAREEQIILQEQNIISLIVVPMMIMNKAIGFIGFDFTKKSVKLNDNFINALRIVGEIIVNALERKRYEENINSEKNFAQKILENMGQGLTLTDEKGQFEYVNPAFSKFMGYNPEELIGKHPFEITKKDDFEILNREVRERRQGRKTTYETNLIHKDGSFIPVMITGVPRVRNNEVIGTIAVVTNLTKIKKMENDLRKARDEALEALKLKSNFISNMSHELRTPMFSITGMIDLLKETELNSQQKEYVQIANNSSKNLLKLIEDILDFSKLSNKETEIDTFKFNLKELFEKINEFYEKKFKDKELQFMFEYDDKIPKYLLGDYKKLKTILTNLLENSLKFTNSGFVKISVESSKIEDDNIKIKIKIIDTGIGINNEYLSKLFEPFNQEDGTITRKYGGTGLGLSIVKGFVEMMKGIINVISEENKGTTFIIELPLEIYNEKKEEDNYSFNIQEKISELNIEKNDLLILLEDFLTNSKKLLEEINLSYKSNDYSIFKNKINSLKSSISFFGDKKTYNVLNEINNKIENDDYNINNELNDLNTNLKVIFNDYNNYINKI